MQQWYSDQTLSRFKPKCWHTWNGYPVIDGDKDDLRFLDPKGGHIVALYAKGAAKKDTQTGGICTKRKWDIGVYMIKIP